jgi:hypothetical protein
MAWATLLLEFGGAGESAGGELSLELDWRPGGLNGGKTSFVQGDQPGYLLHLSDGLQVVTHYATDGVIVFLGDAAIDVIGEAVVVTAESPARLRYRPEGAVTLAWVGAQPEGAEASIDGSAVTLTGAPAAVLTATYQARARQYRLANCTQQTVVVAVEAVQL